MSHYSLEKKVARLQRRLFFSQIVACLLVTGVLAGAAAKEAYLDKPGFRVITDNNKAKGAFYTSDGDSVIALASKDGDKMMMLSPDGVKIFDSNGVLRAALTVGPKKISPKEKPALDFMSQKGRPVLAIEGSEIMRK
jgi:hypothetical protein